MCSILYSNFFFIMLEYLTFYKTTFYPTSISLLAFPFTKKRSERNFSGLLFFHPQ